MGSNTSASSLSRRARTRERLIAAATDLLLEEGRSAMSVSAVSRRVGVNHSLFYQHFKDMDACLAAAARRVLERLVPIDRELRRRLLRHTGIDRRLLADHYFGALGRWLEHRPFVELLLAHRLETTPMGQALTEALDHMRAEYAEEVWDVARALRLPRVTDVMARATADLHLSHWLWALEAVTAGRMDRSLAATMLAETGFNTTHAFIERGQRPPYEELVTMTFSVEDRKRLREAGAVLREMVENNTDAQLLELLGAGRLDTVAAFMVEAILPYYMPDPARHDSVVRYHVTCEGQAATATFLFERGQCRIAKPGEDHKPFIEIHLGLRTWIETLVGIRHLEECFRTGDIRVVGDLRLAGEFVDWFYFPYSGV